MKKVWVVYVTVVAGIRGANGYENLYHEEHKFGETVSPVMAETWARDLVGKSHAWTPLSAVSPTRKSGLVVSSRAVEEQRAPEHVCGLSGYGAPEDPPCPGCAHRDAGRQSADGDPAPVPDSTGDDTFTPGRNWEVR